MLHSNARINDIIEVIVENNKYFGMYGQIIKFEQDGTVIVNIHGNPTTFQRDEIKLKARKGTKTHAILSMNIELQSPSDLTNEDYNELINLALDLKDYEWAYELKQRKDALRKV